MKTFLAIDGAPLLAAFERIAEEFEIETVSIAGLEPIEIVGRLSGRGALFLFGPDPSLDAAKTILSGIRPDLVLRILSLEQQQETEGSSWSVSWPADAFVEMGLIRAFDLPLEAESFGSPFLLRFRIECFATRRLSPPVRTYGPAAPGGIRLWDREAFRGLGRPVDRSNPSVVREVLRAQRGEVEALVAPGFASLLPRTPSSFSIDGISASGVLCGSVERASEYVLLSSNDVRLLQGYPFETGSSEDFQVSWAKARALFPLAFARALAGFLHQARGEIETRP